ncbi:MAG: MerR family transcriptional regulator [Holophaga sp.]|nr:MerR family transcriptional regulator [Holophaga sp.]
MRRDSKAGCYMIGVVAIRYQIHPQTLRLYEREGLLLPSRTEGKTRLYSEEDLERLEFILSLTRDLGVNLAGVEVVMGLRDRMESMQVEMKQVVEGFEERLRAAGIQVEHPTFEKNLKPTSLVKLSPQGLRKRS